MPAGRGAVFQAPAAGAHQGRIMQTKALGDHIITVDRIYKTYPNGIQALYDFSARIRRQGGENPPLRWPYAGLRGCGV